jgi:hypothetical protein
MTLERTSLRLRALHGSPLRDLRVRSTVEAATWALAERHGMTLDQVLLDDDALTITLQADRLAAVGFLAELRRSTDQWNVKRAGVPLWGEHPDTQDSA